MKFFLILRRLKRGPFVLCGGCWATFTVAPTVDATSGIKQEMGTLGPTLEQFAICSPNLM